MFYVASYFDVAPKRHQDFIAAALQNRRDSLANEPRTERFELVKDANDPDRFHLHEAYADKTAFDEHKKAATLGLDRRFRERPNLAR